MWNLSFTAFLSFFGEASAKLITVMELPLAPNQNLPTAETLLRAVRRANMILARMVGEETQLDVATIFSNADHPQISLCNFASEIHASQGQGEVEILDRIEDHFRTVGSRCRAMLHNSGEWPAALAEQLQGRGYQAVGYDLMILLGYKPAAPETDAETAATGVQLLPGRAVYRELLPFFVQVGRDLGLDEAAAQSLARIKVDRFDEPRAEPFIARLNKQIVGLVNVVTLGQIGVIEDFHILHRQQHSDLDRTLLTHAIEHCQRAQFEQVILEVAQDNQTARSLYRAFGFTPMLHFENYIRVTPEA